MLPDNRMRFPAPKIDFENDVGLTGQDHDNYPAANSQARFDWMRMALIALLANQSSYSEPTEYCVGTTYFDLNTNAIKICINDIFVGLSQAIQLDVDQNNLPITLQTVYSNIKTLLGYAPTATFSGHSSINGATSIPIPNALRVAATPLSRPFIWVDGTLVDPRNCSYASGTLPVAIQLSGGEMINKNQTFIVLLISINSTFFSQDEVIL